MTVCGGGDTTMSSSNAKVSLATTKARCGDMLEYSNGGIKVMKANVRHVEISGQLTFTSLASVTGHVDVHLYRGSTLVRTFIQKIPSDGTTGSIYAVNFSKIIISASQNDVFYLYGSFSGGSAKITNTQPTTRNYLTVRVIG